MQIVVNDVPLEHTESKKLFETLIATHELLKATLLDRSLPMYVRGIAMNDYVVMGQFIHRLNPDIYIAYVTFSDGITAKFTEDLDELGK
jgi:aspartokinase-like uncharacterized kinase